MVKPPVFVTLTFLSLWPAGAWAADIHATKEPSGDTTVTISGRIGKGDATRTLKLFDDARTSGSRVASLVLSGPGGDVDEGLGIARTVKKAKSTTVVPDMGVCASSCFLVWAAGLVRRAGPGARIGVHSLAQEKAETLVAKARTVDIARTVFGFGTPPGIVGRMVVTEYNEIYWLTAAEIALMSREIPPLVDIQSVPAPGPNRTNRSDVGRAQRGP